MSLGMSGTKSSNRSDATSESSSNAYGYDSAVSGSQSQSVQNAVSGGQSSTTQGIAFSDIFQQLFQKASGAADSVALNAPQLATAASQLFTGGSQFLQSLGGNAGLEYQEGRLNGTNPELENAIAALKKDSESIFSDEVDPVLTSEAVAGGFLGGGQQGVARGIAQGKIGQDFLTKAAGMRLADVQSKDAMAANIAGNSIAAASTGLGALPGLLDLQERGANAELGAYSSLASILGGPTVLSQSQGTDFSRSTAQSVADAFSRSFGEQTSSSESTSTASSRGRSRGWGFNFGLPE